ncbi:MAG: D-lyxose/D-mannose family sugar isomerase [Verrucomicrobiales bacterium]|jgi:D-lyxose ketol-isomerase|nr:D-lyxose/D-mannose family sugar isomerase [Verrucomicrobiales bacterium]
MKRSDINRLIKAASASFAKNGHALPPHPRWDVTDFGLGDWSKSGLVLVNLAEEAEYCEKLMYAQRGMMIPAHTHKRKKEDIISRAGVLRVWVWANADLQGKQEFLLQVDGVKRPVKSGDHVDLQPGSRVTLTPGIYHGFESVTEECVIGEVSTANDDVNDNFFVNPDIGRYPEIEEDEEPLLWLLSDKNPGGKQS